MILIFASDFFKFLPFLFASVLNYFLLSENDVSLPQNSVIPASSISLIFVANEYEIIT